MSERAPKPTASDRSDPDAVHRAFLARAARIALRGHGGAEPNPMVGCLLVDEHGTIVAEGFHRRCGEAHAEAMALARAGDRARGTTAYVTLEPCNHHGRTPPCSGALIRAGVRRVIYAQPDPNPIAVGGAETLRGAGIEVRCVSSPACDALNAAFLHRITSGLPWTIAKWAQTIDGAIATRSGHSQWISSERSRRMVHRERGRVDAIMTGLGTAIADDPQLTARGVRMRRRALRILIDPALEAPRTLRLFETADAPTIVASLPELVRGGPANGLRERGIDVMALGPRGEIRPLLAALARERSVATVLVEAGGGLVGNLFREGLVQEAWVFTAPRVMGDAEAPRALRGDAPTTIADARRFHLLSAHRRGDDLVARYRVMS
jgi:diaminohydroxyphosphoribosylaminopyrimidine deaminase / 5-amino-6-(5-phosphoribosylamino)uracil reductase